MIPVVCKSKGDYKFPTEMHAVPRVGDFIVSACGHILRVTMVVWRKPQPTHYLYNATIWIPEIRLE